MDLRKKTLQFEIKQVGSEEDRVLRFIGSDDSEDRDNDVIEVNGWQLENYLKNPVFLWAHDYRQPPVGQALQVWTEDSKLMFDIKFATRDQYPFADVVYQLYKGGFLRATSVGFRPLAWEQRTEGEGQNRRVIGLRFTKQELLELSAVPVPANPNALQVARSKGIDTSPLEEQLGTITFKLVDKNGLIHEESYSFNESIPKEIELGGQKFFFARNPGWMQNLSAIDPAGGAKDQKFQLVIDTKEERIMVRDAETSKDLGEVSLSDEIKDWFFGERQGKAGAVLSRKNKQRLQQARDLVDEVLKEAEPEQDNDDDDKSNGQGQSQGEGDKETLASLMQLLEAGSEKELLDKLTQLTKQVEPAITTRDIAKLTADALKAEIRRLQGKVD